MIEKMKVFCGEEQRGLDKLIVQDGYIYATDGHIMVRVKTDLPEPPVRFRSELSGFYTDFKESEDDFTLPGLNAFAELKTAKESVDCEECDGDGEVEWEYKDYTESFDCPVCAGIGSKKTGKLTYNYSPIKIKESRVNLQLLIKILEFAELIDQTVVTTSSSKTRLHLKIGESQVVLMCLRTEDSIFEITKDGIIKTKNIKNV